MRRLVVIALMVACGKSGDKSGASTGGSGSPAGAGTPSAAKKDPCQMISKADVEPLLGGPATIEPESSAAIGSQVPSSIGCDWDWDRRDQVGDVIGGTLLQLTIWDGDVLQNQFDIPGFEPYAIGTKGKIHPARTMIKWVQNGKTIELDFSGDPDSKPETKLDALKAIAKKLEAAL